MHPKHTLLADERAPSAEASNASDLVKPPFLKANFEATKQPLSQGKL
jgi:hypothetical protein